jgi:replicative DNA helicase
MHHMVLATAIEAEHFYRDRHRLVFEAMRGLYQAGEPVDVLTVADQLRRSGQLEQAGGVAAIDELAGVVPSVSHAVRYSTIVRDLALARKVLTATYEIQGLLAQEPGGGEELLERAEQLIFQIRPERRRGAVALEHAVSREIDRLEQASKDDRKITGIPSGFAELDALNGGLQDGKLVVLAARPGVGKSAFALNIALHVALIERQRVLFGSLEMSEAETARRYLAQAADINGKRLHTGNVGDRDWPALLKAASAAVGAPFEILDDGSLSVSDIRAHARQLSVAGPPVRLVVVDYLQLLRAESPTDSRTVDVSNMSRALKVLAREVGCPVIALSQLNRRVEERADKRPLLGDLRESGAIEADADEVWMLYRDELYDEDSEDAGLIEVIVAKNRHGELGKVVLGWDGAHLRATAPGRR